MSHKGGVKIQDSVELVALVAVQIGVTIFAVCGALFIVASEFFLVYWHNIALIIACVGMLLVIAQRIFCQHRVPASIPPVIRAFAFCFGLGVFVLMEDGATFQLIDGVVCFFVLYFSQLWIDRIDCLSGGYVLLVTKLISRIAVEHRRRAVRPIEISSKLPILVIDPFGWYSFSDAQLRAVADRFPHHLLVDSLWKVRPVDYPLIEVIFGAPPKRLLKSFVSLSWIHIPSSGMNGYDNRALYSADPRITSSAGVYGVPIAEYALALMFTMSKGIYSGVISNKCGYGNDIRHSFLDFQTATVLVVGVGDIGKNIARRCAALGTKVIGIKRNVLTPVEGVAELYTIERIDEVLPIADFVVLCLPATEGSNNLINKNRLGLMKATSVLVNVGRGNAVNQKDLKAALRRKDIAAAALDVTTPDPLLPFCSLLGYRDLLCTLHHSSISEMNSQRAMEVFLGCLDE